MSSIAIAFQVLIALGIVNVWVIRRDRATAYRPDGASNIAEEFARYGFSDGVRTAVGATKLTLAGLLLVGIVYSPVAALAAGGMALLMAGAIAAHIKVGDPLMKSVPALLMLAMSTVVLVVQAG